MRTSRSWKMLAQLNGRKMEGYEDRELCEASLNFWIKESLGVHIPSV